MKENEVRTHRVGSVTTGAGMVLFGTLFLVHYIWGILSYEAIFALWPLMLVGMGIEVLVSNSGKRNIVYDKPAIFLLIVMTLFVMLMGTMDFWFREWSEYGANCSYRY